MLLLVPQDIVFMVGSNVCQLLLKVMHALLQLVQAVIQRLQLEIRVVDSVT